MSSVMIPENLVRQSDVVPMKILTQKITVIGAGAIGSWTVLSLAKMGFGDLAVWDHDVVDEVNFCSQSYGEEDVGRLKVERLQLLVRRLSGVEIQAMPQKWQNQDLEGIVILAVDSMSARRAVFERFAGAGFKIPLIIDSRMAIESALLYTYNPVNLAQCEVYKKSLYSDEEAVQERCTGKSTIYTALMIAGLIARTVRDFTVNGKYLKFMDWNIKFDVMTPFYR